MVTPVFIQALLLPTAYPHPVENVRLIETHISWVLIAGDYAYKIKKPVNFSFLDFSTLERRKRFCAEEIRLNQRLAPEIYLEVISIHGAPEAAHISGEGPLLEYAVKMRAFTPEATLDCQACITPAQIDAIATRVARFHRNAEVAPVESDYGTPENVQRPVRDNLSHIRAMALPVATLARLDSLASWSEAEAARLEAFFMERKRAGFIRECHGDLHLGNIAWVDEKPLIFDCIEFNPRLRYIDTISETAFMVMDLQERGHSTLAWRYLNRYLEWTGDYAGMPAWRFYLVYRALVRAKVDLLRASQDAPQSRAEALRYIDLALALSQSGMPRLWLMQGVSGSGKSWLAEELAESSGAFCLRSDIERKRLFGLDPLDDSGTIPGGIYTAEAGRRTFDRLRDLARGLLADGHTVIIDATFLQRRHRQPFIDLARDMAVEWRILSLQADPDLLRRHIIERAARADDASEATLDVLEAQLASQEPLSQEESAHAIFFDQASRADWPARIAQLSAY